MLSSCIGKRIEIDTKDYVIFDLETTGISTSYDEVIEISALKVQDGIVTNEFSELVNPGRNIPSAASRVNGITDDMVKDAPAFEGVLREFLEFAGDHILIGHNIHSFDMKFIYRDCLKYFGRVPDNDYIDTLYLARKCLPSLSHHRLVDLADYYQFSTEGAHRALNDCHMNQKVFEALMQEKVHALKAATTDEAKLKQLVCPRCGNLLKKRNGKFGQFYGCSGFPYCRYTRNEV